MKKVLSCLLAFAGCLTQSGLFAQDIEKEFAEFEKQQNAAFEQFKKKADADFENSLRQAWEEFDAFKPLETHLRLEPPQPVVFDPKVPATEPVAVPVGEERTPEDTYEPVEITMPEVEPAGDVKRTSVLFYGVGIELFTVPAAGLQLKGSSEADVADAWKYLCKESYETMLYDCLSVKKQYHLNDWAYLLFTKAIGMQLYGADKADQITFLQMFLLTQSGYKVRLAKIDGRLRLLIATADNIYGVPYLTMDGLRYYVFEPFKDGSMSIYTYRNDFADAKNLISLRMDQVPELSGTKENRVWKPENASWSVRTSVDKNLIDFYRDYPQCDVAVHYHTPMSVSLCAELYAQLKEAVAGKGQREAAALLLHFVQTAFPYQTDGEQFGYEKPNFPDETFYYPYCDCEDRAMLYAVLVRDLLGLKAVLLDYPNHIASAVCFTEDVSGDYLLLDNGQKYVICDPTYIGAPVGACMEQYKNVAPGIIR